MNSLSYYLEQGAHLQNIAFVLDQEKEKLDEVRNNIIERLKDIGVEIETERREEERLQVFEIKKVHEIFQY